MLLSILGLFFTAVISGIDLWSRRFFRCFFIVLMVCCFSGFMEVIFLYCHVSERAVYFALFLGSLFPSLLLPMLTVYMLYCCKESIRKSKLFRAVLGFWIVYLGMLASAAFTDKFYYYTLEVQFQRGPWYPISVLPLIVIMLLNLAGAVRYRKRLTHKIFVSFLVAIVPLTITLIVQLFADVFPLIDISIVLSGLAMFGIISFNQIEQDIHHQRDIAMQQLEIANQKASIMVLQMRPHFIYNTMTSIYCLCNQDPVLARQVIMDFTAYLRKNFTAVASYAPIPFSSELEHTRAYLAVEQAQYNDSLFVDYDTPHTCFRVPPLTLQPIVENAVKHGRDPYAGPFHISVRTKKTELGSEIIVADNGRGFSDADNSGPHIALKNIQQRLELMCGGKLVITPNNGGGTVVTITVPDSAAE